MASSEIFKSACYETIIRLGRWLVRSVLLLFACNPAALAQLSPIDRDGTEIPTDLNGLHFFLITVDVGNNIWDNFGHTALRLYDENTNTDLVFNWGVFDAGGGVIDFSYKFFSGAMSYRLETSSPTREFDAYRAQGRW